MVILYNGVLLSNQTNELLIEVPTWMNLRSITLSERNQTKKVTFYVVSFMTSRKSQHLKADSSLLVARV